MTEIAVPTLQSDAQPAPDHLDWKDLALAGGVLFVMIVVLVVGFIALLVTGVITESNFEDGSLLPALVGYQTLVFGLAALVPVLRHRRSGFGIIGLRPTSGRSLLLAAGLGVLLRGLVILALLAVTATGVEIENPQADFALVSQGPLLSFLLLVLTGAVLTALTEELLFRGILFGWLRTHLSFWPAGVISSLVFGLFHGVNVVLPVAFAIGLVCAYLYERTRSIWPAVVVHLSNNLLVFVAARLLAGVV